MSRPSLDLIFVGGGLANLLAAWRLAEARPHATWQVLEASSHAGGTADSRTWSFHESDLTPELAWASELATHSWPRYTVRFEALTRDIEGRYLSVRSRALHGRVVDRMGDRLRLDAPVQEIRPDGVTLASGERLAARMVVDGRGFSGRQDFPCGYQKFLGLALALAEPHGLSAPVLMDATVDQTEGLRFVYVLPWTDRELLVEDTYYGTHPGLAVDAVQDRIYRYVADQGWRVERELGRERGVLPIPFAGDFLPDLPPGVAASGVGAGRFHPTTGYSFAAAAGFAEELAGLADFSPDGADELNRSSLARWKRANSSDA